jgi:glycosyltransferase involved in cell wall biosynthesis
LLTHVCVKNRRRVQIVFIDDGSTDQSGERGVALLHGHGFDVSAARQPNSGASAARAHGLHLARGEWVLLLDADDELAFDPVPYTDALGSHTSAAFSVNYLRRDRHWYRRTPIRLDSARHMKTLSAGNPFASSSLLWRRIRMTRSYRHEFPIVEDWLFWIDNPDLFESMRIWPEVVSAHIHLTGANTTSDYARWGWFREAAARSLLDEMGPHLKLSERNNLAIQRAIGCLQQGHWQPASSFTSWPCDARLFAKMIVYSLSTLLGIRATWY